MKKKIIFALKIALNISLLGVIIYALWQWPIRTVCALVVLGIIIEHRKMVWIFFITAALSCIGGTVMIYVIHFICTGEFFIDQNSLWALGWLFTTIYAMGLIVEEDNRAPYIWLWRQMKKVKKIKLQLC